MILIVLVAMILGILVLATMAAKAQKLDNYSLCHKYMQESVVVEAFGGKLKKEKVKRINLPLSKESVYILKVVKYKNEEIISVIETEISSNDSILVEVYNEEDSTLNYCIMLGMKVPEN